MTTIRLTTLLLLLVSAPVCAQEAPAKRGPVEPPNWARAANADMLWKREIVQTNAVTGKHELAMIMGRNDDGTLNVVTRAGTAAKLTRSNIRISKRMESITAESEVQVGDAVEILYSGSWYQGRVLGRAENGLRMHYVGWASSWDAVVPWANLRRELRMAGPVKATRLRVGQKIQVEWSGKWYAAEVLERHDDGYKIHYTGWADSFDEKVGLKRIRYEHTFLGNRPGGVSKEPFGEPVTAETPLEKGQQVGVSWSGEWFLAIVLGTTDDGKVRLRYAGWGSAWDETVSRGRLRTGFKIEAVEAKPPSRS